MSQGTKEADTVRIVQFTDTHFFAAPDGRLLGVDTAASFAEVFKLSKEKFGVPDLYLHTGDISQDETEDSYRRFSEAMDQAGAPCYFLPGNHDRRDEMRRGLSLGPGDFRFERHVVVGGWLIVLLDSLVENEVGGELAASELKFLDEILEAHSELPALVALHHHPVPMDCVWMDTIGLANAEDFFAVLENHEQVRSVLWGHVHQEFAGQFRGVELMATPSTCVQFKPRTADFTVDAVPPGFRWLKLSKSGGVRSKVERTQRIAIGLELSSAGY